MIPYNRKNALKAVGAAALAAAHGGIQRADQGKGVHVGVVGGED